MKRIALIMFLILVIIVLLTSCNKSSNSKIIIGRQYGIAYAPLTVMEDLKLIEKYLPEGTAVEWVTLGSGAALNESLAAKRLSLAFMGTPPALIAWDKGINVSLYTNLCNSPVALQVANAQVEKLADFKAEDKIAVAGIGSIQHIVLAMGAEKEFGNARAFDNNIVAMAHPDAATMMASKSPDLAGHITNMPYILVENNAGCPTILTSSDVFDGDISTIVGIIDNTFAQNNPLLVEAFDHALTDAFSLISNEDETAIKAIAQKENLTPEQVIVQLNWGETLYTKKFFSVEKLAEFMHRNGYIEKSAEQLNEFYWSVSVEVKG